MAQFTEVMRHARRMCESFRDCHCSECPIGNANSLECGITVTSKMDCEEVERRVMQWAAEHPEPVYPTWDIIEKVAQIEAAQPRWISVSDRLPDNEVDVLVCVKRKRYSDPSKYIRFVAKAFHTDGKTNTRHSGYVWSTWEMDMNYDEEADAYIIPEGWWESVEYGDEFNAVDDFITHWMPLPEPPKEAK